MRSLFSKQLNSIAGTITFVVLFFNYWKTIIVNTDQIFQSASIGSIGDEKSNSNSTKLSSHKQNGKRLPTFTGNDTSTDVDTEASSTNENFRFFILPSPDIDTILKYVPNRTKSDLLAMASEYYSEAIAESSAEMWLRRGFERLPARVTKNPKEADVYIVVGYCHLFSHLISKIFKHQQQQRLLLDRQMRKENRRSTTKKKATLKSSLSPSPSWVDMIPKLYKSIVIDLTKPHLILIPTWNPEVSRRIGLHSIVRTLQLQGVADTNIWSVGFERNPKWQPVPLVSRILPIPYVVRTVHEREREKITKNHSLINKRMENSIFYVGDPRPNAPKWAGCSRSNLVDAFQKRWKNEGLVANMDIRLVDKKNRLNQTTYQTLMRTSEYCLVLCGDTPSSRTLTSAVVEGCIPVRVGSRLWGLCDPPCHEGFGWNITGKENPHLPYLDRIPWEIFPEIDEASLLSVNGNGSSDRGTNIESRRVLHNMIQRYDYRTKRELYIIMHQNRMGFLYGWGDPVTSQDFGNATSYIWDSFLAALRKESQRSNHTTF